ncbi:hypothetical protein CAI21_00710 [Alkalilimnicola ehrlichii]|uniref:UPF0301 protein CAL65_01700 n=1 Tax=Alkalilimnicola ehrlichii TaxID=351052 RepID=A0A3E0X465_9GAMM|nr:YqgE/AlgH family protein [Alkalilimnicola ehrlichii]RFA31483.1 hypothetical protein CAI21_00710 [Alkalilimnicola ehrlichii]RFA39642.1 hypothetical protein CAL65_01700 [Alkalilimnicola ehrlichii]
MTNQEYLSNHFLIAMPTLADPNFAQTVTYICEHNEEGAMGIVINRPIDISMSELFNHLGLESDDETAAQQRVYMGGPVQRERGFVLHSAETVWEATLKVSPAISITTSRDILDAIAQQEGPKQYLVALGYAGWEAGQLEAEIAENSWLSGPADASIIFEHNSNDRWQAAASLLGVDLSLLSTDAGHA